jgi:hypothetical protein
LTIIRPILAISTPVPNMDVVNKASWASGREALSSSRIDGKFVE